MKLRELIMQEMVKSGIEEANSVRVILNGGESLIISNDKHPVLEQEVGEGTETKVVFSQSARAGLSGGIIDRLLANPIQIDPAIAREIAENPEFSLLES